MKFLDVVGLVLLACAGLVAWVPLGLALAGGGCLWLSWSLTQRKSKPTRGNR